jgi:inorganic triphosphatase YgiF
MSADQVERELKLGAWPEFVLPDLAGAAEGVKPGAATERELDAIYYDTRDLHLLRRGATLRFRRGEPPGDVWTAKLPSDSATHGLARREITVAGRREAIPEQFADLTRGWALGQRLVPVARVRTVRTSLPLCDDRGRVLATLDDDSVTVTRGRRVVARFRELEVELVGDAPAALITAVDERLRAAGAEKVPQIPKLSRALGRAAALPWQLATPELEPNPTMAAAAQAHLIALLGGLVDLHAPLVLGAQGSAEHARKQARALGSAFGAFAPLFEPPPSDPSGSLDWFAAALAPMAELDAILERVEQPDAPSALGGAGASALADRAAAARGRAHARLLRVLRDRRYTAALTALARMASGPPPASRTGNRRVASAGTKFVRSASRALRDDAAGSASMEALARLDATLVLASVSANDDAWQARERVDRLVVAGEEGDQARAVLARVRALARRGDRAEAWAAGVVAGLELARARAANARFADAWEEIARKGTWP